MTNNNYSSYNKYRPVFICSIKYYSFLRKFDYEKFYDFLKTNENNHTNIIFRLFIRYLKIVHNIPNNHENILNESIKILNQLVFELLSDSNGQKFYSTFLPKPKYPKYTGFLDTIEQLSIDAIAHVHTLNHDLVFEKFGNSAWINNNLSDGFETANSPFYGLDSTDQKVILPYFNNKYNTPFRLHKLHGSIDYYPYHFKNGSIDTYLKISPTVGNSNLFKHVTCPSIESQNDWSNFHSDFLSGTTSKIKRYKERFYEKQLEHFENNLRKSIKLIIVGYGCKDHGINNIIEKTFNGRPIIIINPNPGKSVLKFQKKFKGRLVKTTLEQLTLKDLN